MDIIDEPSREIHWTKRDQSFLFSEILLDPVCGCYSFTSYSSSSALASPMVQEQALNIGYGGSPEPRRPHVSVFSRWNMFIQHMRTSMARRGL